MPDALFERDGTRFVPTELCRGPWSPDAQHGGPPAALMARAAEGFEGGEEMQVARLTVELLRPVPLVPLTVTLRWARPGRKVQIVEVALRAGDTEVARALALRIRRVALPVPPGIDHRPPPPPLPGQGSQSPPPWGDGIVRPAFHADAVEHRFVGGGFDRRGPPGGRARPDGPRDPEPAPRSGALRGCDDVNLWAAVILTALLLDFAVERLADVLDLGHLGRPLPPELRDVYDAERYRRAQRY